jgi:hypothetical protein
MCFKQVVGCRIRGHELLKEIDPRVVNTATEYPVLRKEKADMDPKTYPS